MPSSNPLEHNLFSAFWDDGLLDLLCGLGLLTTGVGWLAFGPLATLLAPLWIVLWRPLRERFVEPRSGFVRFSKERRTRIDAGLTTTLTVGIGALVFVIGIALFIVGSQPGLTGDRWIAGLPAVLVAIAASLSAMLTGARRFHLYALALAAGAVAVSILRGDPAIPLIGGGVLAALTGASLLTRFISGSNSHAESS